MGEPPEFWQRVAVRERSAPEYLKPEELVRVLRQFLSVGDRQSAHRIGEELMERWGQYVLRLAWKWFPHSEPDCRDMRQEVWTRLWHEMANPQRRYWEQSFRVALDHLCIDVRRAMTRPGKRGDCALVGMSDEDREQDETGLLDVVDPGPGPLDALLRAEHADWLVRAFPTLPLGYQRALFLRHILGWPVSSHDPDTKTISAVLDVDPRTVRNYLRHGARMLREWYEMEHADGQA
jgi:DNA-directed RNA polymerase specialized sigma24 family protein